MLTGLCLDIRNSLAIVTKLDYPHVYFKFVSPSENMKHNNEDNIHLQTTGNEKHRSFTASPQLFSVKVHHDSQQQLAESDSNKQSEQNTTQPTNPVITKQNDSTNNTPSSSLSTASSDNVPTSSVASSTSSGNNNFSRPLISVFASRPAKVMIMNIEDEEKQIDARLPQGVHFEHCKHSKFSCQNKVTKLDNDT